VITRQSIFPVGYAASRTNGDTVVINNNIPSPLVGISPLVETENIGAAENNRSNSIARPGNTILTTELIFESHPWLRWTLRRCSFAMAKTRTPQKRKASPCNSATTAKPTERIIYCNLRGELCPKKYTIKNNPSISAKRYGYAPLKNIPLHVKTGIR
jgi:hypothetical protein